MVSQKVFSIWLMALASIFKHASLEVRGILSVSLQLLLDVLIGI